ncbi:hypothetical protein FRB96_008941 [Tulasnella sp. 330]|nr:hypothetical protein FRB96_008941 [Tulasnella sp. 330]
MDLPVDLAHLIGIFIGLTLYGVYVTIFLATLGVVHKAAGRARTLHSALFALFILCTGYYATYDIYLAFIKFRSTPGTIEYLSAYKDAIAPSKDILYMISLFITDSLLIYRLYKIWPNARYAFAVVAVLMCGMITAGFAVSFYEVKQAIVGDARYVEVVYHWTAGGTAVILSTNVFVTSCIAARLWWLSKQVTILGHKASSLYKRVLFIVVQSGAIYCSCVITQLILYAAGSKDAVYLFLHVSPAVVALTPTAIILQLNLQRYKRSVINPKQNFEDVTTHWAIARPAENNETFQAHAQHSIRTLYGNGPSLSTEDLFNRGPGDHKAYATGNLRGSSIVSQDTLQAMEPDYTEAKMTRQVRSYTMDDMENHHMDLESFGETKQARYRTL